MRDLAHLHALLFHEYGLDDMTLSPLQRFGNSRRGIFRVTLPGEVPRVLRVYQHELPDVPHPVNSAPILRFLEQAGFPAPCAC